MKFILTDTKGKAARNITEAEAKKHLTTTQIQDGIEAKMEDPMEDVCYMVKGGYIHIEF